MNATIKLTIDLEVEFRFWLLFSRKQYAKASFEGEMEVGDLKVGETLTLEIFNTLFPTCFVVRNIERIPNPITKEVRNVIDLYVRMPSLRIKEGKFSNDSIGEAVTRIHQFISPRLEVYGLQLIPESAKVSTSPTYYYLPTKVSSTSFLIADMSFR